MSATGKSVRHVVFTGLFAAGTARAAYALLAARPPGGAQTWTRTNHRGEPVTLLEGPAVAAGAVIAVTLAGGARSRPGAAAALAGVGACACGGYDDLAGSGDRRGFRGHIAALLGGELTTGACKLGGIGATGVAAAAVLGGPPVDTAINAGLIAGSANLINLFDLRPGRAIKVALAAASLGAAAARGAAVGPAAAAGGAAAAAAAGSAAALLPEDLGERAMLGDAGANAVGAVLGAAAAASLPRGARLALLGVITGLTAASEVISFTKVIERTAPLRWLDMAGRRRPARAQGPAPHAPVGPHGAPGPDGEAGSGAPGGLNGATAAAAGGTLRRERPRAAGGTPQPPATT